MPKVLTVNNYTKREEVGELVHSLQGNGAEVTVVDWTEASAARFNDFDGVVLSGSREMLSEEQTVANYAKEIEAVREASAPIFGVCYGHQLLGVAFGARVVRQQVPTIAYVDNDLVGETGLFRQLPRRVSVFESHYETVETLPAGFSLIARSPSAAIGGMKHDRLPIQATQFHPERNDGAHPDGNAVVRNFVSGLV